MSVCELSHIDVPRIAMPVNDIQSTSCRFSLRSVTRITDVPRSTLVEGSWTLASRRRERTMAKTAPDTSSPELQIPTQLVERLPLWELDVVELTGHSLEARGREQVNQLLRAGWRLLHIYTLKYKENSVWRERPMAILGRLRNERPAECEHGRTLFEQSSLM